MEILCIKKGNVLELYRNNEQSWIRSVYMDGKWVGLEYVTNGEPILSMGFEETISFTEIEHVMDNWDFYHMVNIPV